jgi:hypothetical protein
MFKGLNCIIESRIYVIFFWRRLNKFKKSTFYSKINQWEGVSTPSFYITITHLIEDKRTGRICIKQSLIQSITGTLSWLTLL